MHPENPHGPQGTICTPVYWWRKRKPTFLQEQNNIPGARISAVDYKQLTSGLLAPGLVLFGDNAYINSSFMATPFPNVSAGCKDDYNFYHSQLRIRVECAFGMLVHCWGILRSAISNGITIQKTVALVNALVKLHNYCIDCVDLTTSMIREPTTKDLSNIVNSELGYVLMESVEGSDVDVPIQLMDCGTSF